MLSHIFLCHATCKGARCLKLTDQVRKVITLFLLLHALISVMINMIFSKYFLEATYRILRNITIQSIFHCLDMFFLLPQGKYSRILETMEIEEDNCSSYLVPRISSNKQTERNRDSHFPSLRVIWSEAICQTWPFSPDSGKKPNKLWESFMYILS